MPRARPSLAQNCKLYAIPNSRGSLLVEWSAVYPYHGEDPESYRLDVYNNNTLTKSLSVEDIDEAARYSYVINGLTPGNYYKAIIVAINSQG